jgi:hypothetical protein
VEPSFGFRPLYSIVEEISSAFAVGRSNETFQPLWAVLPSLLLLIIGSVVGLIRQRRSTISVWLYLLIPLLGFYAVTFVRPLFSGARHLLLIAPPFYLLVAYGLAVVWQRVRLMGVAALAVVLIFMGWWLNVQFSDPAYLKDDMRAAACTIAYAAGVKPRGRSFPHILRWMWTARCENFRLRPIGQHACGLLLNLPH